MVGEKEVNKFKMASKLDNIEKNDLPSEDYRPGFFENPLRMGLETPRESYAQNTGQISETTRKKLLGKLENKMQERHSPKIPTTNGKADDEVWEKTENK